MALFPMFVDLKGSNCLVIGGGEVALRKIEQLIKFSPNLTVIAISICDEIKELALDAQMTIFERPYHSKDLEKRFMVIGALDDLNEQKKIYDYCKNHNIPVNCVDSPQLCSFIFPALVVENDLCIGINTSGRAPAVSSALRKYLEGLIPHQISELINDVDRIRKSEPPGKNRQEKIIGMCTLFFDKLISRS